MYFDIAMPVTLFMVTLVSLFLNPKVEGKLKMTFEEREFTTRDAILLVVLMGVMISFIALTTQYGLMNPIMILFLFSYSMLLFTFTYLFSNKKWYLGIIPPAIFVALYLGFRDTPFWSLYLVNVYAAIFAVLITLYMASLFTWKTTWIFTILITIADVILVFVTKAMVEAAKTGLALKLPIAIFLPIIPFIESAEGGLLMMSLGLGDFFFAGLLSIQLLKRYGRKSALLSLAAITVAFFILEIYLLNFEPQPFPATLVIILGWLPVGLWKSRHEIRGIQIRKLLK